MRAVGEPFVAREDVEAPEGGRHLARRQDGGRAGCRRELRDHGRPRRSIRDRGDRGVAPTDVLPAERLGDLAGARRRRQRRRIDADEVHAQGGDRKDDQHGCGDGCHAARPPHDPGGEPRPAAAGGELLQALRRQRVDPRAEPVEEGRQRHERDDAGRQRHEHAAEAHRVEELLREDEQAGHRRCHGERAEDDGATRAPHRRRERLGTVPVPCRLLAPPRDDEERVVDREAEPEPRDEVQREDGERMHVDRDPEPEERERDRAGADERRQERGDEAAKHPERQQQDERERDQLGPAEIALDRRRHLARGDRAAAESHLRIVGERGQQPVGGLLRGFPAARVQEGEHDPVLVDRGAGDGGVTIDPGSRSLDDRRPAGDEREHTRIRLDTGAALDLEIREPALGREVGELSRTGLHARDHGAPDPEGGGEQGRGDERDEPSPGCDQVHKGSRHRRSEAAMAPVATHSSSRPGPAGSRISPRRSAERAIPPRSPGACARPGSRTLRRRRARRRQRRSRAPASFH